MVFAFQDGEELGPRMLARTAKHSGLTPEGLQLPASTPAGRSVVLRITSTGLPRLGASCCKPPEPVSTIRHRFIRCSGGTWSSGSASTTLARHKRDSAAAPFKQASAAVASSSLQQ